MRAPRLPFTFGLASRTTTTHHYWRCDCEQNNTPVVHPPLVLLLAAPPPLRPWFPLTLAPKCLAPCPPSPSTSTSIPIAIHLNPRSSSFSLPSPSTSKLLLSSPSVQQHKTPPLPSRFGFSSSTTHRLLASLHHAAACLPPTLLVELCRLPLVNLTPTPPVSIPSRPHAQPHC